MGNTVVVCEFDYSREAIANRAGFNSKDPYAGYDDSLIESQWLSSGVRRENIIRLPDIMRVGDLIVSLNCIVENGASLEDCDRIMESYGQEGFKREIVLNALKPLADSLKVVEQEGDLADL